VISKLRLSKSAAFAGEEAGRLYRLSRKARSKQS
jgi:hypothetical protein